MGGGGKGGGIPHQFRSEYKDMLGKQNYMLGKADAIQGGFLDLLPLGDLLPTGKYQTEMMNQATGAQLGFNDAALRGALPAYGKSLESLSLGMEQGFTGDLSKTVSDMGGILEGALRPSLQRAYDFGEADIFEGAARSGMTRSSTTTDQLGRFREGLESQLLSSVGQGQANILGTLAPLQAEQRMGATQMGLGLPGMTMANMNQPQQFGISTLLQGLQLPYQAMNAASGAMGSMPVQQPGSKGSDAFGALAGAAAATAPYWLAALGICWVARAAYGNSPKWHAVRRYVLYRAPQRTRELYTKHGPAIATRLARMPAWVRTALRLDFDDFLAARA